MRPSSLSSQSNRTLPYTDIGLCGTTLFSAIAGELLSDLKAGCRLASRIEEDLIRRHWPVGLIYGSEAELCDRFHVGRAVAREAVRVLEVRGCARMRRGRNGGLLILRPSRTRCVEMAADYLQLLTLSAAQIDEADSMLGRVKAQLVDTAHVSGSRWKAGELAELSNVVMPFFEDLTTAVRLLSRDHMNTSAGSKSEPLFHRSRASQIARHLMSKCTPEEWARGIRLGSTFDLCERYNIDRDVLRQAIRILESAGLAASLIGRGHGIISQAPRPASVCRLISSHFSAHGVSYAASMKFHHCISVEAIAKVATVATPADVDCINRALDKLRNALEDSREKQLADSIYEAEERQLSLLCNPLIDLLLRSTKAFSGRQLASIGESPRRNQIYLAATRRVAAAISSGDPALAVQAQHAKIRRLAGVFPGISLERHG